MTEQLITSVHRVFTGIMYPLYEKELLAFTLGSTFTYGELVSTEENGILSFYQEEYGGPLILSGPTQDPPLPPDPGVYTLGIADQEDPNDYFSWFSHKESISGIQVTTMQYSGFGLLDLIFEGTNDYGFSWEEIHSFGVGPRTYWNTYSAGVDVSFLYYRLRFQIAGFANVYINTIVVS